MVIATKFGIQANNYEVIGTSGDFFLLASRHPQTPSQSHLSTTSQIKH